jgi:VIT1/CCC1 family predicted Fe2+/Mn2+ transporter
MELTNRAKATLLAYQQTEITEYHIYTHLAHSITRRTIAVLLERIAQQEREHYQVFKSYTKQEVQPNTRKIWFYYLISRIFGFTFGIKLMEKSEEKAQANYEEFVEMVPELKQIIQEENEHETVLIDLLDEERLQYTGSIVLGLNDALVELTGALAGLTLALQHSKLVALTGSITGIAAAFSMAASEYLSTKSEDTAKNPIKASVYTGIAYIITVLILIFPYVFFGNIYLCLGLTLIAALLIIAGFTYYISIAKDEPFRNRFLEMAGLSLSVAALSFGIGILMRIFFGIEL